MPAALPRRLYSSTLRAASLLAIPAFILAGCGEPPRAAAKPPLKVRVRTAAISSEPSYVTLTGEIKARVQSDLAFRIAGRIATRTVDVGDRVAAGQVLATLETNEQSADVSSAQAGMQSAEATLKQAAATFERQKTLLAQGYTTQTTADNAKQGLEGAQASLESAKAALATAQDRLDNASLRADARGVVTARNAEAGQVVEAAQTVFTVAQDGTRDAVFDIYEALLAKQPDDDRVELALLSNPSIKTVGRVREVAPTIDPATGTVRVKVGLDETPPEMGLGAAVSGVGRFKTRDVFVLPWTAFFVDGGKPAVWIVDRQNNAASPKPVVVDSYRTGELLLSSGIEPGDLVVTAGAQLLQQGQIVAPEIEARPAGAMDGKP